MSWGGDLIVSTLFVHLNGSLLVAKTNLLNLKQARIPQLVWSLFQLVIGTRSTMDNEAIHFSNSVYLYLFPLFKRYISSSFFILKGIPLFEDYVLD